MNVELTPAAKKSIEYADESLALRDKHYAEASKEIASVLYGIIEKHEGSFNFAKNKMDNLRKEIAFCQDHKFYLEADAKLKVYSGMSDIYYSCRDFFDAIQKYAEALDY